MVITKTTRITVITNNSDNNNNSCVNNNNDNNDNHEEMKAGLHEAAEPGLKCCRGDNALNQTL